MRRISRFLVPGVLAGVMMLSLVGPAAAQAPEALVITAENVTAGERENAGDAVLPGDVVLYRLTFTNVESTPVRNIVLGNPIPQGLEYVPGSAAPGFEGASVQFSIDGGQTFSSRPMIDRVVDGRRQRVPAPPETYTNVRWTLGDWVQPGDQVRAEFRATLPDSGAR